MLRLIIGAVVVGTVGYLGYKAYKSATAGSGLPGAQTSPVTPAMIQNEKYISEYDYRTLRGGCMGCMGGAVVQIL